MTIQCPACRAENTDPPACRRCRADLTLLWSLQTNREQALDAARQCVSLGQPEPALAHVECAQSLRQGADAERLAAVAYLLLGKFPEAWHCYQRALRQQKT